MNDVMPVTKTIRSAAKAILGPKATALVRRVWAPWPPISAYASRLQSKRGIEIGGPSSMFADDGPLPVYRVLGSVDNCLYSSSTIWTGDVQEGRFFKFHPKKPPGAQIISEAADLRTIPDAAYSCVLACHCLEHVANPIRALAEWKRILYAEGLLLLILPHRDGTFDRRRPVTPLSHMIADYEQRTAEDDLTHLPEILELHDHSLDPGGLSKEQFRERSLQNHVNRALHHHVFDSITASQLVDFAGFQILRIDTLKPCHIIILANRTNESVNNRRFLQAGSKQWRRSPFPSDRIYANQRVMKSTIQSTFAQPPAQSEVRQPVCAVIVTYHPALRMFENLRIAAGQVDGMVIVDNGSNPEEVGRLRDASQQLGFQLIENRENLGIAEALNQGVQTAKARGYPWVVLFDQDSSINSGFIDAMFETWSAHPQHDKVAAIHPTYRDPKTGLESQVRRAKDGGPITSMTSGALMPVWVFDKVGWFASEYFIDCVDTEYCFRIRAAGYLIADSNAVLAHSTGNSQPRTILGFSFRPTYHSTMRRYYMSRNRIVVFRKYVFVFPRWAFSSLWESTRETIKCFLGEPDRSIKFRRFLLGTWDGLTGRMGKREGL